MEKKATPLVPMDFDLAARDEFIAARANPPLIERGPLATRVPGSKNIQTIFWGEMLVHAFTKLRARGLAIGRRDENGIIQIPIKI